MNMSFDGSEFGEPEGISTPHEAEVEVEVKVHTIALSKATPLNFT
jgi:hypothetical protein